MTKYCFSKVIKRVPIKSACIYLYSFGIKLQCLTESHCHIFIYIAVSCVNEKIRIKEIESKCSGDINVNTNDIKNIFIIIQILYINTFIHIKLWTEVSDGSFFPV